MSLHTKTALLTAAFALAGTVMSVAQTNGSNSPYSRYGFGLLSDRAQGFNKGMAGTAYAMRDGIELNAKNPASYSAIDSLTFLFDVGFSLQNANLKQGGTSVNAHNTSYDYLNMGFRAAPNVGISLGLLPFSTIGYNMSKNYPMPDNKDITQTDQHYGDGGVHEVYVGAGWRIFKPLSLGFNVGYLWGDMTNTVLTSFSQTTIATTRRQYAADIRTYKFEAGAQFEQRINKKNSIVLGLTYGLGHDIKSKGVLYNQKVEGGTALGDTVMARNAYSLPHTFGVGLTWNYNNSLRVGMDYTFQKWSDVKSPVAQTKEDGTLDYQAQTGLYTDMHKVSIGAEYIPDNDALKWRKWVRYRFGFSYTSPYTRIDGRKGPESYLVSLGAGLPIINRWNNRSILNLSAQYEHVKPKMPGMITERYLRLCIGISFNETWFMKWKVN